MGKGLREEIVLPAPAKINLTLDVKYRRPDGYHELETVMHQINLVDTVYLRRKREDITVSTDSFLVPRGAENLAYRAAAEFFRVVGLEGGVDIYIEKRIPIAAGLAGGSTDAAAVIKGLNMLYACNLSMDEMLGVGEKIGSDVPFCIFGGTALARGRGEVLTPLEVAGTLSILLVKPNFSVSTREVYEGLAGRSIVRRPDTGVVRGALATGDIQAACRGMENVLEAVTFEWYPEVASIKKMMLDLGALQSLMSGSGPTVFGIFYEAKTLEKAYAIMKRYYQEVYPTTSWTGREETCRNGD